MILFKKSKELKAKEDLVSDVKIIIPSAEKFFETYRGYILKSSSRLDAQNVLQVSEQDRFQHLIANFDTIASEALVEALIESGYKKEGRKWTIKNWF